MKQLTIVFIALGLILAGCRVMPPGHDPRGPGNSENAPGHNKGMKDGPGNSENAPGQQKKRSSPY